MFNATSGDHLDLLSHQGYALGTKLPCFSLQGVGTNDKGGRIATAYGVFDGRNRLDAVLAEISENSDESGTQFAPDLGKFGPVHKRGLHVAQQIGRASCRERVCQYV